MQPSKSMVDYMMELNRLFPKTPENDMHTPTTGFQSPFSQATPNYSSSSTDSFSPESYQELFYRRPSYQPDQQLPDTPIALARRPIVGRKFLGNHEQTLVEQRSSFEERFNIEQPCSQMSPMKHWREQTPPNVRTTAIEQKNYPKNFFYELFPGETKGFELKTPVKSPSVYSNVSPSSSISPVSNFGMFTPPRYPLNLGNTLIPNSPMNLGASTSHYPEVQKMCTFCRKNGETPLVYMTHSVKEKRGNRNIVTCPILRSHVCSTCGVSGDNAHTITYCPVLRSSNNGVPLKSTTITLKNTRIKSNGRRRY